MRYAAKYERGYVRSTWYGARRHAREMARNPYRGEPFPAESAAETLAALLVQSSYVRERTTLARCPNCGALPGAAK